MSGEIIVNKLVNIKRRLADNERKEAVAAVNQISEIISQTSDSSSKVSRIAELLLDSVDRLGRTADELDSDMNGLRNEISAFRVGEAE